MRRAYVVDDDEGFRRSLDMLLSTHGWAVETFSSAHSFLERSGELDSGLVLLDVHMPGKSGLDLLESAKADLERFAVVMVTGAGQIETAVRTIRAGALDFIEKGLAPGELLDRLNALDLELQEALQEKSERFSAREKIASLSTREREVLERLLGGASNKLIARALDISPRTVEMHRARMLERLEAETTAEALAVARQAGMKPVVPD